MEAAQLPDIATVEPERRISRPGRPYWLIARNRFSGLEVLTTRLDDSTHAMPVFAFEEEAELFLRLGVEQSDWRVRESKSGELISILCGSCKDIELVAFDPLPKIKPERPGEPVSMGRNEFLEFVLRKEPSITRSNAEAGLERELERKRPRRSIDRRERGFEYYSLPQKRRLPE